ncbi:MAG: hypothetical protein HUU21_03360 [Polyangiaceae bacterium]|nr:hypothetical protein [Polyangiaceae bacterium]
MTTVDIPFSGKAETVTVNIRSIPIGYSARSSGSLGDYLFFDDYKRIASVASSSLLGSAALSNDKRNCAQIVDDRQRIAPATATATSVQILGR